MESNREPCETLFNIVEWSQHNYIILQHILSIAINSSINRNDTTTISIINNAAASQIILNFVLSCKQFYYQFRNNTTLPLYINLETFIDERSLGRMTVKNWHDPKQRQNLRPLVCRRKLLITRDANVWQHDMRFQALHRDIFHQLVHSHFTYLTHIIFDHNCPVVIGKWLPTTLQYLQTSDYYDQSLDTLPRNLKTLIVGNNFNTTLCGVPPHLETLILGNRFKRVIKVGQLPSTLRVLELGASFDHCLSGSGILPEGLQALKLGVGYTYTIQRLPCSLISITLPLTNTTNFTHVITRHHREHPESHTCAQQCQLKINYTQHISKEDTIHNDTRHRNQELCTIL
jgi:hypothetical protein